LWPDGSQVIADGTTEERVFAVPLQVRIEVVRVPRGEQVPQPAVGLEQVDQVLVKVGPHLFAIGARPQRLHVHDIVADQQVGAGSGAARADADGGDARADDLGRASDR